MPKLQLPKDHEYVKGRTCTDCGTFKPASEYSLEKDDRSLTGVAMRSKCKPCNEHIKYKSFIKRTYGITWDDYVSMFDNQGGCCAICKSDNNKNTRTNKMFVDHCHETGKVRGLLCSKCNHGLGHFNDDTDLLKQAIRYLHKD